MAINQHIDQLPDPPTRTDPENFDERADNFLSALPDFCNQVNQWATECNQTQTEINNARNQTYDYMITAQNAQSYCMTAAANADYKGLWSSSETYSKGDAVSYNGYIWVSNYDNNINHTPGTDNYWTWLNPLLNNSGQLTLPFNQVPILVNGQNLMSRTFYVDAVNGDDNNPGTADMPFKTLKKAIDSVPVGGHGEIHISNDLTLTEDIDVTNKKILLIIENNSIFSTQTIMRGSYYSIANVTLTRGSALFIYLQGDSKIVIPSITSTPTHVPWNGLFSVHERYGLGSCSIDVYMNGDTIEQDKIFVGVNTSLFAIKSWNEHNPAFVNISLSGYSNYSYVTFEKTTDAQGYLFVRFSPITYLLFSHYHFPKFPFRFSDGSSFSFESVITGIQTDSNGNMVNTKILTK